MLRADQKNYSQQTYAVQAPGQPPRRKRTISPFLQGVGVRLGNGKEIPLQEQVERNLHLVAENIMLQIRENAIQTLLHHIDTLSISSPQVRQKLQDWRMQFSDHENWDTKTLAFFLGFLYVNILEPILNPKIQEVVLSNAEKCQFEKIEDSCLHILKLILTIDVEDYLEICLIGIAEEKYFQQQMNRVDKEMQIKIAALNQVVQESSHYLQTMFMTIKKQLLLLQKNRQARFDAAEEQLNLLNQRVEGAQIHLLAQVSRLEKLGEQEDKIAPILHACCDLLEGVEKG